MLADQRAVAILHLLLVLLLLLKNWLVHHVVTGNYSRGVPIQTNASMDHITVN